MRILKKYALVAFLAFISLGLHAQGGGSYDVFVPIAKYIGQGDADRLSAWFADNLEVSIQSQSIESSRKQARQIMRTFFVNHTPQAFNITHTASKSNVKYALGRLNTGGDVYLVTIFVSSDGKSYKIQQLKIDKNR